MTPLLVLLFASRLEFLLQHGGELRSQRHADQAIPFLREALDLAKSANDIRSEALAWAQLGGAFRSTHQEDASLDAFAHERELGVTLNDGAVQADALSGLAGVLIDRGSYADAQKYERECLEIGARMDDVAIRLRALNGLAVIGDRSGRSAQGLEYARIALAELDAATRDGKKITPQAYFSIPYNLGKALSEQGDYARASQFFERARSAAERMGMAAGMWHVLHETGEMYRAQGDLNTAVRYYQRALAEANRIESRDPEATTLRALGACAEARGDFQAALAHYHEALALFEKIDFGSELPQTLTMLARMQFMTGDREGARRSLDRAADLAAKMPQPLGTVLEKLESGHEKFESGDFADASAEHFDALEVARKNDLDSFRASALLGLADIARAEGDLKTALQRYAEAADAIDTTRARIPSIEERSMYVAATHAIYDHWLDALLAAGQPANAFLVLERERSRNVLEALLSQQIERRPVVVALNHSISSLQVELTAPALTPQKRSSLLAQLDDAERRLDYLQTSIKPRPAMRRDLASLQRSLTAGEAWIEFTTRPNRVIAFVVTRDRLEVSRRAAVSLASRIEFFNDLLDGDDSADAVRPAAALSDDLLAGVVRALPESVHRLIVGVAGDLAALPFDALTDPARPSRPIVERYEIAYAPSLATLAELRERHAPPARYDLLGVAPLAGSTLAAVGLPAYRSAALAPLPWSRREVDDVARLVQGRVALLVGDAATENAFKRMNLRDYKVIHLATHALLDPEYPSRSGIVFSRGSASDDGWLQMREIYQLDLAGQLVVLSACQTAFGMTSSAEGMHSLARAFTYAGANAVVGTLWKVEDQSASKIVRNMYAGIKRGEPVSAALRDAQLAAAGDDPYRNARQWAGWVATGDPAVRPIGASVPISPWLAAVVITAAFFWGFSALRRA